MVIIHAFALLYLQRFHSASHANSTIFFYDSDFDSVSEPRELLPSLLHALHVASITATANKVQNLRRASSKLCPIQVYSMVYHNCFVKMSAMAVTNFMKFYLSCIKLFRHKFLQNRIPWLLFLFLLNFCGLWNLHQRKCLQFNSLLVSVFSIFFK